ncbi:MAG: hypothetical protein F6K47_17815 [Symploca sp. SIO2E6]|nr:hypothetical protein [Symploca sp. SIO2E6]
MESQKTQINNAANQLEKSMANAAYSEQQQPAKKSRKVRPFPVIMS